MEIKLAYGVRDGKTILISEIKPEEKGLRCSCFCPYCKKQLIAKIGRKRKHHFAHAANYSCDILHAQETGLHSFAKQVIKNNSSILLPSWKITTHDVMGDCQNIEIAKNIGIEKPIIEKANFCNYSSVVLEADMGFIKPDALLSFNGKSCAVEILVTHSVDGLKEDKVKKIDLPMFEIDLSNFIQLIPAEKDIIQAVLNTESNRKWIHNPKRNARLLQLQDAFKNQLNIIKKPTTTSNNQKKQPTQAKSSVSIPKPASSKNHSLHESDFEYPSENYYLSLDKQTKQVKPSDESKAREALPTFSFSKGLSDNLFFINIPISGDSVFNCDRRIWQGLLFDEFIYKKRSGYYSVSQIKNFIFDKLQLDQRTDFLPINERDEANLPKMIIKKYFEYMSKLGFVIWEDYNGKTVLSNSLIPPNGDFAKRLDAAIKASDESNPHIDSEISKQLFPNV